MIAPVWAWIVIVGVLATAVIKLADWAAPFVVLMAPKRFGTRAPDWTPIFSWAAAKRDDWEGKPEGPPERKLRLLALTLVIDRAFRSPVLVSVQAIALLATIGAAHGTAHGADPCTFSAAAATTTESWQLAAALSCVAVAISVVVAFLHALMRAEKPDSDGYPTMAGQKGIRTKAGDQTISTFLVIPAVTAILILAYASLYQALFAVDPGAFAVHTNCAVDAVGAVYLSTVIAATVGFGDIVAVSDWARVVVISEIFVLVTLLALFIASSRDPRLTDRVAKETD